jgi:hypothetical protein
LAYLAVDAARRVGAGQPADEARADLLASGFSDADADVIVRGAVRKLRKETRRAGALRLTLGCGMTILGGIAVLGAGRAPGTGWYGYMILGGGMMFGSGLLAMLSGLISALTGRTPPIGPIPREEEVVED